MEFLLGLLFGWCISESDYESRQWRLDYYNYQQWQEERRTRERNASALRDRRLAESSAIATALHRRQLAIHPRVTQDA